MDPNDLLQLRRNGGLAEDKVVNDLLDSRIAGWDTKTAEQGVDWDPQSWLSSGAFAEDVKSRLEAIASRLPGSETRDGYKRINRTDVASHEDPLSLFLATMAWGYGPTGYGWFRTSRIIKVAGIPKVENAVNRLQTLVDPREAFVAWSRKGTAKLYGLNTAFASKVAYFATNHQRSGTRPLIADMNTAWALWALTGEWDSRESVDSYVDYVEWAGQKALLVGCKPDDIERALFEIGPPVRKAWFRSQRAFA